MAAAQAAAAAAAAAGYPTGFPGAMPPPCFTPMAGGIGTPLRLPTMGSGAWLSGSVLPPQRPIGMPSGTPGSGGRGGPTSSGGTTPRHGLGGPGLYRASSGGFDSAAPLSGGPGSGSRLAASPSHGEWSRVGPGASPFTPFSGHEGASSQQPYATPHAADTLEEGEMAPSPSRHAQGAPSLHDGGGSGYQVGPSPSASGDLGSGYKHPYSGPGMGPRSGVPGPGSGRAPGWHGAPPPPPLPRAGSLQRAGSGMTDAQHGSYGGYPPRG